MQKINNKKTLFFVGIILTLIVAIYILSLLRLMSNVDSLGGLDGLSEVAPNCVFELQDISSYGSMDLFENIDEYKGIIPVSGLKLLSYNETEFSIELKYSRFFWGIRLDNQTYKCGG